MDFGFLAQGEEAGWAPAKATYGCSSRWLGRYSTTIGSLWFDLPDACAAASEIARRGLAVRAKLKDVFPVYDEGWRARLGKDVPLPAEVQGWVDVHRGAQSGERFWPTPPASGDDLSGSRIPGRLAGNRGAKAQSAPATWACCPTGRRRQAAAKQSGDTWTAPGAVGIPLRRFHTG